MRLLLTLLVMMVISLVNVYAQTSLDLDYLSYNLVKNRESSSEPLVIFQPAVGYEEGDFQLFYIAIPYSPFDVATLQFIDNLASTFSGLGFIDPRNWIDTIKKVFNNNILRNSYLPYETFKVALVLVYFVPTETMIETVADATLEATYEAIKSLKSTSQDLSEIYYTSMILEIMSRNINKYNVHNQLMSISNEMKNNVAIKVSLQSYTSNQQITCIESINENCIHMIEQISIDTQYNAIIGETKINDGIFLHFTINIERRNSEIINKECTATIEYSDELINKLNLYTDTILDKIKYESLQLFLKYILPSKGQLTYIFPFASKNDLLDEFSKNLNMSIYSYYDNILTSLKSLALVKIDKTLPYNPVNCDTDLNAMLNEASDYIERNIKNNIYNNIDSYTDIIGKTFKEIVDLNEQIKSSARNKLKTDLRDDTLADKLKEYEENYISAVVDTSFECTKSVLVSLASSGEEKLVKFMALHFPIGAAFYIGANAVWGFAQKQIQINVIVDHQFLVIDKATVCTSPVNVLSRYELEIENGPIATIYYGILGYTSNLLKLTGNSIISDFLYLIPIVKLVFLPADSYFVVPSKPGIYSLSIKLDATNLAVQFKEGVKSAVVEAINGIKGDVTNYLKNKPTAKGLISTINNVIIDSKIFNTLEEYVKNKQKQVESEYQEIKLPIISFPPIVYGTKEGNFIRYMFGYDIFGIEEYYGNNKNIKLDDINTFCTNFIENIKSKFSGASININWEKETTATVGDVCALASALIKGDIDLQSLLRISIRYIGDMAEYLGNKLFAELSVSRLMSACESVLAKVNQLSSMLKEIKSVSDEPRMLSYLLAAYPTKSFNSSVLLKCYTIVASPYFAHYMKFEINERNLPLVLLAYSEELASEKSVGDTLFNIMASNSAGIEISPSFTIFGWKPSLTIDLVKFWKDNNKYYAQSLIIFKNSYNDLYGVFKSNHYKLYVTFMSISKYEYGWGIVTTTKPKASDILTNKNFESVRQFLEMVAVDRRTFFLPPIGDNMLLRIGGINSYFTAFKIYPAIAVRESYYDLNAYYLVIPNSIPARELFVLGTVGDYVLFDGEPKRTDNKPFLYVDLVGSSTR